jgi:polyhydroxyalkanoate synthesis regulator phasin
MKKAILILFTLFIVSCSSNTEEVEDQEVLEDVEDQEVSGEMVQEEKTSILDDLIKKSDSNQSKIYIINKAVDSSVTKKIEVTTKVMTNLKETVTELKEVNETLKDSINTNVGRPYKLLPILSDSKNNR